MSKLFTSIVSALLAACLAIDPSGAASRLATISLNSLSTIPMTRREPFLFEAINPAETHFEHPRLTADPVRQARRESIVSWQTLGRMLTGTGLAAAQGMAQTSSIAGKTAHSSTLLVITLVAATVISITALSLRIFGLPDTLRKWLHPSSNNTAAEAPVSKLKVAAAVIFARCMFKFNRRN